MTTSQDYDCARHLEADLYDGKIVPNVRAFNGHLGGQALFINTGTSQLLWGTRATCFFPFWDSPLVIASGEISVTPDEVKPLLLDIQRVSAACRYDRRIVITCPGSRWDAAFIIGPYGKYIKGLKNFDEHIAHCVQFQKEDTLSPSFYLKTILGEHSPETCIWQKCDRVFAASLYAGGVVQNIKAFNPEQGGRILVVCLHPAWKNLSTCYFPFWDSPHVLARGDIPIQPSEVKPLLFEMQRVSQEQGYKYPINIECWGSKFRFSIGPKGQYITGIDNFEQNK
ncbi:MAG: hypothetical protein FWG50_00240 [Kiritimatiellaeota bacterium]|nr:hypothetical protein [Kiritimatiellota bacterium]